MHHKYIPAGVILNKQGNKEAGNKDNYYVLLFCYYIIDREKLSGDFFKSSVRVLLKKNYNVSDRNIL